MIFRNISNWVEYSIYLNGHPYLHSIGKNCESQRKTKNVYETKYLLLFASSKLNSFPVNWKDQIIRVWLCVDCNYKTIHFSIGGMPNDFWINWGNFIWYHLKTKIILIYWGSPITPTFIPTLSNPSILAQSCDCHIKIHQQTISKLLF